jgi:hypothetical protein
MTCKCVPRLALAVRFSLLMCSRCCKTLITFKWNNFTFCLSIYEMLIFQLFLTCSWRVRTWTYSGIMRDILLHCTFLSITFGQTFRVRSEASIWNVCGWSCCSAVQTTPWYIFVIWNNKVIEREFALHMHCILINIWPESKSLQWNNLRTNKPRLTIMHFYVLYISWWTTDRIHILWWQQWRVTKRQIYLRGTCD